MAFSPLKAYLPPTVNSVSSASGSVSFSVDEDILVRFNKQMDPSSINTGTLIISDDSTHTLVTGTIMYSDSIAVFSPVKDLMPNTAYTVTLTTGVADKEGHPLEDGNSFPFSTGDDHYTMSQRNTHVTDFIRDGSRMMQVNDYVYSFGGWTAVPEESYNDVYRSKDDLTQWEKRPDAPWHGRHVFGCVKMNNKIYVMGGDNLHGIFDVWSTDDGENWTMLSTNLFGNIMYYGAVAHNNALYVMGGVHTDKVWRSYDGITWTEIASGLDFLHRNIAGSVISFNGRIWLVSGGGDGFSGGTADKLVYSSEDGIAWRREPDFPGIGVQYTDVTTWDNKLWVIGGYSIVYSNMRDIWYMDRKGKWTQYEAPLNLSAAMQQRWQLTTTSW
jgi:N-acetylneuraminic acid mutarotase